MISTIDTAAMNMVLSLMVGVGLGVAMTTVFFSPWLRSPEYAIYKATRRKEREKRLQYKTCPIHRISLSDEHKYCPICGIALEDI